MDENEKFGWFDIVGVIMAFIGLTIIGHAVAIKDKISNAFNKLRNKMSSEEKKETVETKEEKKEVIVLPIFDIASLVGKTTADAIKLAADNGFATRIMSEDGKSPMMGDMMVDLNRLKFDVVKGLITKVVKG